MEVSENPRKSRTEKLKTVRVSNTKNRKNSMDNYAIDTAARFGEIPFVEFTKELLSGVFDTLLETHLEQMEAYTDFVDLLTQSLSTYINDTKDGVSFDQISNFILNYELPKVTEAELTAVLGALQSPSTSTSAPTPAGSTDPDKWWKGLISSVGPALTGLIDKIEDPGLKSELQAITDYNNNVTDAGIPSYKQIHNAIASLICSNKYGLLQTMAKQGMLRLVVTEGEIETKITFSTWNTSSSGSETTHSDTTKLKTLNKTKVGGGLFGLFSAKTKNKERNRVITVNTAKSYQRDTSGTKVDIFGRVLIRFKTDYAPLNG